MKDGDAFLRRLSEREERRINWMAAAYAMSCGYYDPAMAPVYRSNPDDQDSEDIASICHWEEWATGNMN